MNNHLDYYPDFIARHYDKIYNKLLSGSDIDYYLGKIKDKKGPVLELGVGTGRLFLEALNSGADIHGIDISPEMVKILKRKLDPADHHRISVQNAVDFNMPHKFSLIVAPFRMFSHLLTVKDQQNCLQAVAKHLIRGGEFIMDLFVPNIKMLAEGIKDVTDFEEKEGRKSIKRIIHMHTDLINQINHVTMDIVEEESGVKVKNSWSFQMRYFFRFELEHLIQASELSLEGMYGDFNKGKLNSDSKEFIVHCAKPN